MVRPSGKSNLASMCRTPPVTCCAYLPSAIGESDAGSISDVIACASPSWECATRASNAAMSKPGMRPSCAAWSAGTRLGRLQGELALVGHGRAVASRQGLAVQVHLAPRDLEEGMPLRRQVVCDPI